MESRRETCSPSARLVVIWDGSAFEGMGGSYWYMVRQRRTRDTLEILARRGADGSRARTRIQRSVFRHRPTCDSLCAPFSRGCPLPAVFLLTRRLSSVRRGDGGQGLRQQHGPPTAGTRARSAPLVVILLRILGISGGSRDAEAAFGLYKTTNS